MQRLLRILGWTYIALALGFLAVSGLAAGLSSPFGAASALAVGIVVAPGIGLIYLGTPKDRRY